MDFWKKLGYFRKFSSRKRPKCLKNGKKLKNDRWILSNINLMLEFLRILKFSPEPLLKFLRGIEDVCSNNIPSAE